MLKLENQDITNSEQQFWNWLFQRPAQVVALLDTTPIKDTGNNRIIYMEESIYRYIQTPAMQRTKKVGQLGIANPPEAYQSRFLHQIQAYSNKIELIKSKYEDLNWRKEIEEQEKQIYLIAECIKTLTHDIGHMPRSHAMEDAIELMKGFHEVIGRKIVLEQKDSVECLKQINPNLIQAMKMVYERDIFGFKLFDEGNIDVDRAAYLPTDFLYVGKKVELDKPLFEIVNELMKEHQTKRVVQIGEGQYKQVSSNETLDSRKIEVYPSSQLNNIENFLKIRAEQGYGEIYYNKERIVSDILCKIIVRYISQNNICTDTTLKRFICNLKNAKSADDIDLEEFIKWDDLKFNEELIKIAGNKDEIEELRELAIINLPEMMKMLNEAYAYIDLSKELGESDREYINVLKHIINSDSNLATEIRKSRKKQYSILEADSKEEKENIATEIQQETKIAKEDIYKEKVIRVYNKEEPIYIEANDIIYEYSHYPNRKIDIGERKTQSTYCVPAILKMKGYSTEQIKEANYIIQEYNRKRIVSEEKGEFPIFQTQEKAEKYFTER